MGEVGNTSVSVQGLSKKFSRSLKRSFVFGAQDIMRVAVGASVSHDLRPSEFWALKDISFDLPKGKSLGLVGLNGSGKTTLLRSICGILRPTTGEVIVDGKIAPMLALGAGFKPVLSGRENVFLNMSLLGVPHSDIKDLFKQVVDFAELWDAIEAPVGTYSTGMRMRLGFACAVHTNPQILVIDEVLAVGDTRFRVKCRNKINELRRSGTSMLLVSHGAANIETLSDECIYLKAGRIAGQGLPVDVLREYTEDTIQAAEKANRKKMEALTKTYASASKPERKNGGQSDTETPSQQPAPKDTIAIKSIRVDLPDKPDSGYWIAGQPGSLTIPIEVPRAYENVSINFMVFDTSGEITEPLQRINSFKDIGWHKLDPTTEEIEICMSPVVIKPGIYRLKVSISETEMHDIFDVVDGFRLVVRDVGLLNNSEYYQPRDWKIGGKFVDALPNDTTVFDGLEDDSDF